MCVRYEGKQPGPPRPVELAEVLDVAKRGNLHFIVNMLQSEKIDAIVCYSTYHIDCAPWHQPSAVILGDAAHAYGPLTGKMANLAVNDAHTLAMLLNQERDQQKKLSQVLTEWEAMQRPKYGVTRMRTYRHLQLYGPRARMLSMLGWKYLPNAMATYFSSLFAYDFTVFDPSSHTPADLAHRSTAIIGDSADPLFTAAKRLGRLMVRNASILLAACVGLRLLKSSFTPRSASV